MVERALCFAARGIPIYLCILLFWKICLSKRMLVLAQIQHVHGEQACNSTDSIAKAE